MNIPVDRELDQKRWSPGTSGHRRGEFEGGVAATGARKQKVNHLRPTTYYMGSWEVG